MIPLNEVLSSEPFWTAVVLVVGCTLSYIFGYWMGSDDERRLWTK